MILISEPFFLQGKGKMVTYWLKGERKTDTNRGELRNSVNMRKPRNVTSANVCSVSNGRALNLCDAKYDQKKETEEAAVPLLSVTTVSENQTKL